MIDYEKLKKYDELAKKYHDQTGGNCSFSIIFGYGFALEHHKLWAEGRCFIFSDIDDLLQKLRELTEPEPRYKVGETWWYLDGESQYLVPRSVLIGKENKDCYRSDDEFYPSKAELIQAQIDYWTLQRNLEIPVSIPYANEDTDYHAPSFTNVGSECNLPFPGDIPAKGAGTIEIRSGFSNHECQHERDNKKEPKFSHFTEEEGCIFIYTCIKCEQFYNDHY